MKKTHILILGFVLFITSLAFSQTFYGGGGAIPDNGTPIEYNIQVQNLQPPNINTLTFGLESVCVNITHTWVADLDISLMAPDSTMISLTSGLGGSGDNYSTTCFNGNAPLSIISGTAPFNGTYRPIGSLGLINNNQNANGQWKLRILDTYAFADEGTLHNWNITFGNQPSQSFLPDSSNIPIVIINTSGQHIPDEPKITAHMGIIDNGYGQINHLTDPFNGYDGFIGVELRGSSSQSFPKKSYALETRDAAGNNNNVSVLGMPAENDWSLIANYSDKTLMRNSFTYDLARNLGYWAPRNRFCELIINNEYMGVYAFMEKIKRDNNRVDIAKLEAPDTTGDALTGGYIIKIDKWTGANNDGWQSNFLPPVNNYGQKIHFQYHYPKASEIQEQQKKYIKAYVDTFETVLSSPQFNNPVTGYYKYMNIHSFVDFFIINELSKNVDGYRLSSFLYKDKNSNGGKLVMGPVWDFDLAYRNANYCDGDNFTGWAYQFGNACPNDGWQLPFWWQKLLTDSTFTHTLKCRWLTLRTTYLDTVSIFNYIDSVHNYIQQAQVRNFQQWPILGVYVWPNPSPLPQTYNEEILALKKWFRNRLAWLDNNMPGSCLNLTAENLNDKGNIEIFPNPASDYINIKIPENSYAVSYCITDISGRVVQSGNISDNKSDCRIQFKTHITSGTYFLNLKLNNNYKIIKLIIIR